MDTPAMERVAALPAERFFLRVTSVTCTQRAGCAGGGV